MLLREMSVFMLRRNVSLQVEFLKMFNQLCVLTAECFLFTLSHDLCRPINVYYYDVILVTHKPSFTGSGMNTILF